ncbi:hypothetical protein KFU94_05720 [Chloroflexi bacterium TSY]|nr:hypothetical protein [Chloroflexi bacterium TSY]
MIDRTSSFIAMVACILVAGCTLQQAASPAPTFSLSESSTETGWQTGSPMLVARSEMPAAVFNGRIYIPGGFGGDSSFSAYDPLADTWQQLADLPQGRHHLMAAAYDGRIYAFGGARSGTWQPTTSTWSFEPETNAWTELAAMPEGRLAGAAVVSVDPNLAFLTIFSRERRDFGAIFSDLSCQKQPISYLEIA